jgi:hypothetical protein
VAEVNGSPLTSAQEKPHIYPSNPVCNWTALPDNPDPTTDWTAFPRRVKDSCKECYTWQYNDAEGLKACNNPVSGPLGFTITFWPAP